MWNLAQTEASGVSLTTLARALESSPSGMLIMKEQVLPYDQVQDGIA